MAVSLDKLRGDPDVAATTIQSPRAYIEDGAFLVALEATENGHLLLEECVQSVQRPRWPLFLGRKACVPTRPVFDTFTDSFDNVENALHRHPWSWQGRAHQDGDRKPPQHDLTAFFEVNASDYGEGIVNRQDAMRTNAARVYGFYTLKRISVSITADDHSSKTNSDGSN